MKQKSAPVHRNAISIVQEKRLELSWYCYHTGPEPYASANSAIPAFIFGFLSSCELFCAADK